MEDALISGDRIFVSKMTYGPRIPQSLLEVPWLNSIVSLINPKSKKDIPLSANYVRIKGYSDLKLTDILVFKSPSDKSKLLVKRCVGLPGDSLCIEDRRVIVNQSEIPNIQSVKYLDRIRFDNAAAFIKYADSLHFQYYVSSPQSFTNTAEVILNQKQKALLLRSGKVKSIEFAKGPKNVYPFNSFFDWTIDNYGPLKIPFKGMILILNKRNYLLYRRVINAHENVNLTVREGNFYINQKLSDQYTFKYNYFFVLGDNRNIAADSRFYGFVPETHIEGKAECVLFSSSDNKIRWNRIINKIE